MRYIAYSLLLSLHLLYSSLAACQDVLAMVSSQHANIGLCTFEGEQPQELEICENREICHGLTVGDSYPRQLALYA